MTCLKLGLGLGMPENGMFPRLRGDFSKQFAVRAWKLSIPGQYFPEGNYCIMSTFNTGFAINILGGDVFHSNYPVSVFK